MTNSKLAEEKALGTAAVYLLLFLGLTLFVLHEPARSILMKKAIFENYNLAFLIVAALAICFLFFQECIDLRIIILSFALTGIAIITLQTQTTKLSHYLKIIETMLMPLLITGFRLNEGDFKRFLVKFVYLFNIIVIVMVGIGILDYFSHAAIQNFFAQHQLFSNDQSVLVGLELKSGVYRYYSIIGHPLQNSWYILIFYMLNTLYSRHSKPLLNEYLVTFISMIGLLLSGSRTALITGLFMFVFLNNRKYKAVFILFLAAICAALWNTSLFQENLMQRFIIGIWSQDASEGRNPALFTVLNGFVKAPVFFSGGGIGYSREVTLMMGGFIKSFEYPFIMLAYDFGILDTFLIYLLILLIPILIFLKNKSYLILAFFLSASLYINGFNGLANYSDMVGQLSFIIMILINISYATRRRQEMGP